MRTLLVISCLWLAGACGAGVSPYARATAGHIGCPADHIQLHQVERDRRGPHAWVAICGPTSYACSSNVDPMSPRARVVCSELGSPFQYASRFRR